MKLPCSGTREPEAATSSGNPRNATRSYDSRSQTTAYRSPLRRSPPKG